VRADHRVLVVDDSRVVRRIVARWLAEGCDEVEVLQAPDGRSALALLDETAVDLILLDVEMPDLDGLGVLRALRQRRVSTPVVMFSTLTGPGSRTAVAALLAGASDVVEKPGAHTPTDARQRLLEQVRAILGSPAASPPSRPPEVEPAAGDAPTRAPVAARPRLEPPRPAPAPPPRTVGPATSRLPPAGPPHRASQGRIGIVAVASSTGGPQALAAFLGALGVPEVPVVCVQHMPESFLPLLASRLAEQLAMDVDLATDGEELGPGSVRIAPGGRHVEVVRDAAGRLRVRASDAGPENSCRPSADVLFRSVARLGVRSLAVVLTGMGQDGASGAAEIARSGGIVLAQDAASSVVWGMPGAVAALGIATALGPPSELAAAVRRLVPVALGA